MPLKITLLTLTLSYFISVFLVPVIRTYKRTGKNPITYQSGDSAHNFVGHSLFGCMLVTFLMLLIYCFFDSYYSYLVPITYLQKNYLTWIGISLMAIAVIWVAVAQYQMRESWRIGIDTNIKTPLVARGLYQISRNPIYFGMLISTGGLFLTLPNMISFALLIAATILVQVQIRLEEEFLLKQHGESYKEYCRQVRRFI